MTETERQFDADMDRALVQMERLIVGVRSGSVSFSVGDTPPETADLIELVQEPEAAGGTEPTADRWAEARAELDAFLSRVSEDIRNVAVVRSGEGDAGISTWQGWGGSSVSVVGGEGGDCAERHAATLRKRIVRALFRLRAFAATVTAATRIAALAAMPGGAMMALPVAFRYVRSMSRDWAEINAE